MAVEYFVKKHELGEWKDEKKTNSFVLRGALGKALVACVLPNTYMNKSGKAVAHYIKSVKAAEKLIVVYDELDLPLGTIKISFNRGSGGHRGLDSVMRAVKTPAFARVRIGVSPANGAGGAQKPQGEKEVERFILGEFTSKELPTLKAALKRASEALEMMIVEGREKAMTTFN